MYDYDSLLFKRPAKKILGVNQNRKEEVSVDILRHSVGCLDDSILSMKALFSVALFRFCVRQICYSAVCMMDPKIGLTFFSRGKISPLRTMEHS